MSKDIDIFVPDPQHLNCVTHRISDMTSAPFLMRHREEFLDQIKRPGAEFTAAFEAIAATGYRPARKH